MNTYIFLKRIILASGAGVVSFIWHLCGTFFFFIFILICDFVLVVFFKQHITGFCFFKI